MRSLTRRTAWLAAPLLIAALALSACGGDDSTPSTGGVDAPPATAQAAGGALSGAAADGGAVVMSSPPPARTEPVAAITVVATDNAFAPAEFRVRAGEPFTVTLENRGQAVHDWRVRGLPNADGKDAGTRLLMPGQSQAITLTIDRPGDFALYCEVHPVDMRGKLSVVSGQ